MTKAGGEGFLPLALWRRGTVEVAQLDGLVPERTWTIVDAVERSRNQRALVAKKLADELHEQVPRASPEFRRLLLKMRRDLHNDRALRPGSLAAVRPMIPAGMHADLTRWAAWREDEQRQLAEAQESLVSALADGRSRLAEVARNEDFRCGIQLSGPDLARNVEEFSTAVREAGRTPKKLRKTESSIVSYAFRVALKPSPFGAFTEIGAHPWRPDTGRRAARPAHPSGAGRQDRVRLTRLSLGLLGWMAHEIHRLGGAERILRLRLNDTLRVIDGRVEYFRRGVEGTDEIFGGERFCDMPRIAAIRVVMEALRDQPLSQAEVTACLVEADAEEHQAAALIEQLVEVGFCHRDLGLPDQMAATASAMAVRLRELGTEQATACADLFARLEAVEREFAAAPVKRRATLLDELQQVMDSFTAMFGLQAPPPGVIRNLIFEDVGSFGPSQSWDPDFLEENTADFRLLQHLLPIFDDATLEKLGLYRFFTARYGEGGRCEDVLEFYRLFAKLSPAEVSELMQSIGDAHGDSVRALRAEFLEHLADITADAGDPATLELDRRWITDFTDRMPDFVQPWGASAYRLQFVQADDQTQAAVINGAAPGYGAFFSRFCDLLEPEDPNDWSLRETLRELIAERNPRQADLTAVLGMNFNLHPRLTPLEVVYPGSVARPGATGVLGLRDLAIEADPVRRRLRLVSRHDGEPIDLVPMNFLFPAAGPMLYRFLCVLAPTGTYRGGLWERLRWQRGDRPGQTQRPRLTLGRLVLDRRTWQLPVCDLPELGDMDDPFSLAQLRAWGRDLEIPSECFFLLSRPIKRDRDAVDWIDEVRSWALSARRARLHKPHYLNFHNPFLTTVLMRNARAAGDDMLIFQECLPGTAQYLTEGGPRAAEEFLTEFRL